MEESERTILSADEREFLEELSDYLDVLSNSTRLRILLLLEREAMDARTLSQRTEISYENCKKHLERLLDAGLVARVPGLGRETSKGVHPAWKYLPVPGMLEQIQKDLGALARAPGGLSLPALQERIDSVRLTIGREIGSGRWMLLVLGGEWDGRIVSLSRPRTELGRGREGGISEEGGTVRVSFPPSYRSVTRLEKPHAVIKIAGGACFLEDAGSRGGTFVNGRRVIFPERVSLKDGDRIMLSQGDFPAMLLVIEGKKEGENLHG